MTNPLKALSQHSGRYRGHGVNHEGQSFTGELTLTPGIASFQLTFKAVGNDGTLVHEEQTTIAMPPDETLSLWSINSNNPRMIQHEFRRIEDGDAKRVVFGFNDPEDRLSYRDEIAIELWDNGDLGYHYAWGQPGGEFAPRSNVRLSRVGQ